MDGPIMNNGRRIVRDAAGFGVPGPFAIGAIVQVRDKRDGAIAIAKAEVLSEPTPSQLGGDTISVRVIEDGEGSTILNGMTIGVPASCVEALEA